MGVQKPIYSFYKRSDEPIVEQPLAPAPAPAPLIELEQRLDEEKQIDMNLLYFEELNSYSEIQHYAHKFGSIQVTSKMKYNEHT
jgi:hypothetical protein